MLAKPSNLGLESLNPAAQLDRRMLSYAIGAMGTENIVHRLRPGRLLVSSFDRADIVLAASVAELGGRRPAGLVLTGNQTPTERVLEFCEPALRSGLPLFSSAEDTFATASRLAARSWPVQSDDEEREEHEHGRSFCVGRSFCAGVDHSRGASQRGKRCWGSNPAYENPSSSYVVSFLIMH